MTFLHKDSSLNSQAPMFGPQPPAARMVEVDMIRGFALFGVLLVNMYGFGADSIAWNSPTDEFTFAIMRIFFESKMWTLFSILFGFGFALQLHSARVQNIAIIPTYLRRLTVLFAFGATHALLFDGDILMLYAELGLVLFIFRDLSTQKLIFLAMILMLIFPLARFTSEQDAAAESVETQTISEARSELVQAQHTDVYAVGSFVEVVIDNADAIPADPLEDRYTPESGLTVLAMFFLGFSIGRSGVLRNIPAHITSIARIRLWGMSIGLMAMAAERLLASIYGYAVFREQQAGINVQFAGDLLFTFGVTALAFGYAARISIAA